MYRFIVCELITGKVLDELPMVITSDLTRFLKMYGEGTLALPLFDGRGRLVSDTWEQAILPQRSMILVVDDADRIVWPGVPQSRGRQGAGKNASLINFPCRTLEAYPIRRYMPTRNYRGMDQASIFQSMLETMTDGGIGLDYDCPDTGVIRDRPYNDDENARVYDRVNELSAVLDGFDWTIDVAWGDDAHTFVRKIARTGYPYLGNRTASPVHTFETGQNVTDFDFQEPWGEGDAATHVRAIGDGEGESKLMSAPVIDTVREAAGWPRLEERRTFSGVTVQTTIDSHARAVAQYLFAGQKVLTLTARNTVHGEDFTRLGDLTLGDTARININTPQLRLDAVWPVVGWSLTPETGVYKPTLAKIGEPAGDK
ncbi:hypothetical protein AOC05_04905 [Arthrobacter alpinus]|uniref:Minor tail protein n=1 Tax=Arthrobacter alpinus TaxID=656366 RepID=A0A0M5M1H0_9MICC|nr:hypothetical protein [Arthrobacter alpinus]ALE91812.1 hypothetical protein AOC05_04905 [Arthrobacter alpinus]